MNLFHTFFVKTHIIITHLIM